MPPRRRQPTSTAAANKPAPKPRRSKLAQENEITAQDEAEIKSAWREFAVHDVEEFEEGREGVLKTGDVRKVLAAQGIPPRNAAELSDFLEILDPDSCGYILYASFVSICALKINARTDASKADEVAAAFGLFTRGQGKGRGLGRGQGDMDGEGEVEGGVITIQHLRRIARELKEDVSDDMLRNMILEANAGAGVGKGVGVEDFEKVMKRAGVFS